MLVGILSQTSGSLLFPVIYYPITGTLLGLQEDAMPHLLHCAVALGHHNFCPTDPACGPEGWDPHVRHNEAHDTRLQLGWTLTAHHPPPTGNEPKWPDRSRERWIERYRAGENPKRDLEFSWFLPCKCWLIMIPVVNHQEKKRNYILALVFSKTCSLFELRTHSQRRNSRQSVENDFNLMQFSSRQCLAKILAFIKSFFPLWELIISLSRQTWREQAQLQHNYVEIKKAHTALSHFP